MAENQTNDDFFGATRLTARDKLRARAMQELQFFPHPLAKARVARRYAAIERGEIEDPQYQADLARDKAVADTWAAAKKYGIRPDTAPDDFADIAISVLGKQNYPGVEKDMMLAVQWKQMQQSNARAAELEQAKIDRLKAGDSGRGEFLQTVETPEGIAQVDARRPGVAYEAGTGRRLTQPLRSAKYDPQRQSELEFGKETGKEGGKHVFAQRQVALDAVDSLNGINEARALLAKGMKTGQFANIEVGLGAVLNGMGITYDEDPVANTQAFVAAQSKQVASIIKAFGAGTGLSDADREFAIKAAGGEIKFTGKAIERILDINDRAARRILSRYKDLTGRIRGKATPFDVSVDAPEEEKQAPKDASLQGRKGKIETLLEKYGRKNAR